MSMLKWAEKEVELACKRENPNWDGKSFDYGCSCYQSALKAYKCLLEDEHSGASWAITASILRRLMADKPLSAITEEDFKVDPSQVMVTPDYLKKHGIKSQIQCPRMSSLFRTETEDGKVSYSDNSRVILNDHWGSGLATQIVEEMYPITLPYFPEEKPYKIYADEYLLDPKNGDFDTMHFTYLITPKGERVNLNRAFTEKDRNGMTEIPIEEFFKLLKEAGKVINIHNGETK